MPLEARAALVGCGFSILLQPRIEYQTRHQECFRRTLIAQPPPRLVTPRPLPTNLRPTSDEARANGA